MTGLVLAAVAGLALLSANLEAGPGAGGGNTHTTLLMPDGTVWTAGSNANGEIGDGTGQPTLIRKQVLSGATSIAVGSSHNLAAVGGQLWGWGHGAYGQLGEGVAFGRSVPTVSPVLSDVTAVAAGHTFGLALHPNGTVHAFGYNSVDGIGDGSSSQRVTPVLVTGLSDAVAIAAGVSHALAIRANGTVVAWGSNAFGKLGDGTTTTRLTPVAVSGLTNIVAVAAAQDSSLALDSAGHVWAWGSGFYGVLGQGTTSNASTPVQIASLSNVTAIAAGRSHAVALVGTTVWTWGLNSNGQLGLGLTPSLSLVPAQVPDLNAISAIGTAQNATFAFAADNGVWGWGDGVGLGDGTTDRRYTPIVLADGGGIWRLATPQFSLTGGNRNAPVTVQITSATPGATVRYTTNGASPTESDPPIPGGGLLIDQPQTVTARAFKSGMPPSYIASSTYTFSALAPTISPGTGTYTSAQSVTVTNQTSGASVYLHPRRNRADGILSRAEWADSGVDADDPESQGVPRKLDAQQHGHGVLLLQLRHPADADRNARRWQLHVRPDRDPDAAGRARQRRHPLHVGRQHPRRELDAIHGTDLDLRDEDAQGPRVPLGLRLRRDAQRDLRDDRRNANVHADDRRIPSRTDRRHGDCDRERHDPLHTERRHAHGH